MPIVLVSVPYKYLYEEIESTIRYKFAADGVQKNIRSNLSRGPCYKNQTPGFPGKAR